MKMVIQSLLSIWLGLASAVAAETGILDQLPQLLEHVLAVD